MGKEKAVNYLDAHDDDDISSDHFSGKSVGDLSEYNNGGGSINRDSARSGDFLPFKQSVTTNTIVEPRVFFNSQEVGDNPFATQQRLTVTQTKKAEKEYSFE